MFNVKISAVKEDGVAVVILEQTLEKLNLRAVIDALNPPTRRHRAKEGGPSPSHVQPRKAKP